MTILKSSSLSTSAPVQESLPNAFSILMHSSTEQSASEHKPLPDLLPERTNKDKLHNAIICSMEKKGCNWKSQGRKHGGPFVRCLTDALWYFDGHQHTLREAGYPVPDYFREFSGYNRPELSKHRKRTAQNMESSTIRHHAFTLKEFLMSSWIKGDSWKSMKTSITELTTHLEGYASYLSRKRHRTEGSSTCMSVTDSMHLRSLPVIALPPTVPCMYEWSFIMYNHVSLLILVVCS